MPDSVLVLSGGLDSAVNLKCALDTGRVRAAVTFDYGQRAAQRECAASAAMCRRYRVRHEVVRFPWFRRISHTALIDRSRPLPHPSLAALDAPAAAGRSAAHVWVPNRNGLFLAVAAAFAEGLGAQQIVAGFNAEEAASFPDNSEEFVALYNKTLKLSTRAGVRVRCYTGHMRKTSIIALGLVLHAPLDLAWSCYEGGRRLCGRCESCRRFLRAVNQSGAAPWFKANYAHWPR
jgi:7-cyano-7-deazaguanine synthase